MKLQKTVVIDVVGLSPRLIGEQTPFLQQWSEKGHTCSVEPVLPAVTCSAQSTYLTGVYPEEHGIVGNGWYFKDLCEVKFWHQSNKLVQAPKIWEAAKEIDPSFTCANLFWWYNMYSSVDYSITPRPQYHADGKKVPDVYTYPAELREETQKKLGTFPLFKFWGPNTSIESSQWIANSAKLVEEKYNPTLTLVYLPHMDYNLQRHGTIHESIPQDLGEIDAVCKDLVEYYESKNANVILLSEYGITDARTPVHINRIFREKGFISVREEKGLELLDAGASRAFAVSDHQVAHVYVDKSEDLTVVRKILESTSGIEKVLDKEQQKEFHIGHDRSGDLVAIADNNSWFTYYYWLDDRKAPDFARTVDIHRKPGFDPVEMFVDPDLKYPKVKAGYKLVKKGLGFRYLMNLIPLDANLVKGSHGRFVEDEIDRPVLISQGYNPGESNTIKPTAVYGIILDHLKGMYQRKKPKAKAAALATSKTGKKSKR